MYPAPAITDYMIGKGIVSFKKDGDTEWRLLGNCPTFEFTPTIEKLDHFSSTSGVKSKDRTVVLSKAGTLRIVTDNWNVENVRLAFLGGDVEQDSEGDDYFEIFGSNAVSGQVRLQGTNEVGPQYLYTFVKVDFIPGQAASLISDSWATIDLTGDVSTSGNSFGTVKRIAEEGETYSEVIA